MAVAVCSEGEAVEITFRFRKVAVGKRGVDKKIECKGMVRLAGEPAFNLCLCIAFDGDNDRKVLKRIGSGIGIGKVVGR